jgi:hypothetical protein
LIGFITTLFTHSSRDYRQYSAIADLQTFQFTFTHALGFPVFTRRILATDLSESHCNFKSHMKSSFHGQIHFLSLFCSCQFRRLDSIQFLCSQAHIPAGLRPETRLFTSPLFCFYHSTWSLLLAVSFHNPSVQTTQKTACIIDKTCLAHVA